MKARLDRILYGEEQTMGIWYCLNDNNYIEGFFDTLELPWKDNQNMISCVPEGIYRVKKRWTKERGWHLHLQNVKGRTWILVHIGNYNYQIAGCILPGLDLKDINDDRLMDVVESGEALNKIIEIMPDEFELEIKSTYGADQIINS